LLPHVAYCYCGACADAGRSVSRERCSDGAISDGAIRDANAWELSPDYTEKDLDDVDAGSSLSFERLLPAMEIVNFDALTTFKCPVFLFEGRHDYTTSHELAAKWFEKIRAPKKELVWFENSAHMVMQEEPGRFLNYLVRDVRPLAASSGDIVPDNEVIH
jgi:pimeloyl-ACP methyl ester carboxylesterase